MNSLLLTGGRVIDPANRLDSVADLLIIDGKISAIGKTAAPGGNPAQLKEGDYMAIAGELRANGLIDDIPAFSDFRGDCAGANEK